MGWVPEVKKFSGRGMVLWTAVLFIFLCFQFLASAPLPAAAALESGSAGSGAAASGLIFSDVPAEHPQAAFINYLAQRKLISGFPDGTYRPQESLTTILQAGIHFFREAPTGRRRV